MAQAEHTHLFQLVRIASREHDLVGLPGADVHVARLVHDRQDALDVPHVAPASDQGLLDAASAILSCSTSWDKRTGGSIMHIGGELHALTISRNASVEHHGFLWSCCYPFTINVNPFYTSLGEDSPLWNDDPLTLCARS